MSRYGTPPTELGVFGEVRLTEVMYYLYLPISIPEIMSKSHDFAKDAWPFVRVPDNLRPVLPLVYTSMHAAILQGHDLSKEYIYVSARKGWASPDNPLNRPGWHCDGFGTNDFNAVWWDGPGTRFAVQDFGDIVDDHKVSLMQFENRVDKRSIVHGEAHTLYGIDPHCVHATPIIEPPGCMRQYVKISISPHRYNLVNNSHNTLFSYRWQMQDRESVRNDTHSAQRDHA